MIPTNSNSTNLLLPLIILLTLMIWPVRAQEQDLQSGKTVECFTNLEEIKTNPDLETIRSEKAYKQLIEMFSKKISKFDRRQ